VVIMRGLETCRLSLDEGVFASRIKSIHPHFRSFSCRSNKITDPGRLSSFVTIREEDSGGRQKQSNMASLDYLPSNLQIPNSALALKQPFLLGLNPSGVDEEVVVNPVFHSNSHVALLRMKPRVAFQSTLVRKSSKKSSAGSNISLAKLFNEQAGNEQQYPQSSAQVDSKPKLVSKKSTTVTLAEGRFGSMTNRGRGQGSTPTANNIDKEKLQITSGLPSGIRDKNVWQEECMESYSAILSGDQQGEGSRKTPDRFSGRAEGTSSNSPAKKTSSPSNEIRRDLHSPLQKKRLKDNFMEPWIQSNFIIEEIDPDEAFNMDVLSQRRQENHSAESSQRHKQKDGLSLYNLEKLSSKIEGPGSRMSFIPHPIHKFSSSQVSDLPAVPTYKGQPESSGNESKGYHFLNRTPSLKKLEVNYDHIRKITKILKNSSNEIVDQRVVRSQSELSL
jgi:hypothetical protein